MAPEKKETIKEWAVWAFRFVTTLSVTIGANAMVEQNKLLRAIQIDNLLNKEAIRQVQADNSMMKMDLKDNIKEDGEQHAALWRYLAEMPKPSTP